MNYKLAEQLKDAGFKQEGKGEFILDSGKIFKSKNQIFTAPLQLLGEKDRKELIRKVNKTFAYLPTLSELIEACGEGFMGLIREKNIYGEISYSAGILDYEKTPANEGVIIDNFEPCGSGESLKIAVAKLWLKLNE